MSNPDPLLYTVAEAARLLNMPESTVRDQLKRRELPGFKIGHQWRLRKDKIDAIIAGQSDTSAPLSAT